MIVDYKENQIGNMILNFILSNYGVILSLMLVILGIINVIIEKRKIKKIISEINNYIDNLHDLVIKLQTNKESSINIKYFLSNVDKIGKHVHGCISYPTSSIAHNLTNRNYSLIEKDAKEFIELAYPKIEDLKDTKKKLNLTFINPFTLYYKGIELVLKYMIGYFLEIIINEDINYENKPWNTFVTIVNIITSAITIFGFFGWDFYTIINSIKK